MVGTSSLAEELRVFFSRLKEAGFVLEPSARGRSLKIMPQGLRMNLMTLSRNGHVMNHGCGDTVIGATYLESLRDILPNAQIRIGSDAGWSSTVLRADGSPYRIEDVVAIQDPLIELLQKVRDTLQKEAK